MKNSLMRFLAVLTAFLTLFALCSCTVTINLAGNSTEADTGTSAPGSEDESIPVSESGTGDETDPETSPESTSGAVTSDAAKTDDATSAETSPATESTTAAETSPVTESTTAAETGTEPLPPESSSSVQSSGAPELTNEELRVLAEDFLNTPGINGLIQSRFNDPRACSIYDVVAQLEDPDVDTSSFDALFQLYSKPYDKTKKINYVTKDNLERLLRNATGWELDRFSSYDTRKPDYFPGEFIYSVQHDSDTHRDVIVTSVSVYQDGRIEALYKAMTGNWRLFYGGDGDGFNSYTEATLMRAIFLRADDGALRILENNPVHLENGLDPLAYEVSQYLNTFGINGIIQSRFFDPLSGVRIAEIIKQLKISVYNYGTIHPENIYADLESGSYTYFPDTGVSYVSAEYLDELLNATTGYRLDDFGTSFPNVIKLNAVDVYVVQHGDMTYQPVKLLSVTPYRNGYLATYQADPVFSSSMLIDFDGDLREVAVMQAYLVRNQIDGRLNIVTNLPVWYASETDNASYIIQPAMLQFNEFTVNAFLQSEYYEPTGIDFARIIMQAGENDANIDYETAYKKYGYVVEEGPGFKGLTGAYLFYLLEKYAAVWLDECAQYENKYPLYLKDEDVYAIQSGGVTYERMRITEFTFDGYGKYTMKYMAAEDEAWYYLSDSAGAMMSATEMQAEICLGADGTFVVIRNSPLSFG